MNDNEMLNMLKVDLGISGSSYDNRLRQYIQAAKESIRIEGIHLDPVVCSDSNLVIQYAAWLWRKRINGDGMPRMLRWALNQRLFHEKMKREE